MILGDWLVSQITSMKLSMKLIMPLTDVIHLETKRQKTVQNTCIILSYPLFADADTGIDR